MPHKSLVERCIQMMTANVDTKVFAWQESQSTRTGARTHRKRKRVREIEPKAQMKKKGTVSFQVSVDGALPVISPLHWIDRLLVVC